MAFIRTKVIKGKRYAYLVENKWKSGRSKQKVRQYLGKVITAKKDETIDFESFLVSISKNPIDYCEKTNRAEIIRDLVIWELKRHGLDIKDCVLDLKRKILKVDNNVSVVLEINEGFMCGATIGSILAVNPECDRERLAFNLARAFVDAGIQVPKEIFVAFFEKTNYQETEQDYSNTIDEDKNSTLITDK